MDFTTGALATRSAARLSDANAARRVPSANARALLMSRPAFESPFHVPLSLRDESNQLLKAVAKTKPRATHRRPASPRWRLSAASVAEGRGDDAFRAKHSASLAARPHVADPVAWRRAHLHARGHEATPRAPGRCLQHSFPGLEHRGVARAAGSAAVLADTSGFGGSPCRNES